MPYIKKKTFFKRWLNLRRKMDLKTEPEFLIDFGQWKKGSPSIANVKTRIGDLENILRSDYIKVGRKYVKKEEQDDEEEDTDDEKRAEEIIEFDLEENEEISVEDLKEFDFASKKDKNKILKSKNKIFNTSVYSKTIQLGERGLLIDTDEHKNENKIVDDFNHTSKEISRILGDFKKQINNDISGDDLIQINLTNSTGTYSTNTPFYRFKFWKSNIEKDFFSRIQQATLSKPENLVGECILTIQHLALLKGGKFNLCRLDKTDNFKNKKSIQEIKDFGENNCLFRCVVVALASFEKSKYRNTNEFKKYKRVYDNVVGYRNGKDKKQQRERAFELMKLVKCKKNQMGTTLDLENLSEKLEYNFTVFEVVENDVKRIMYKTDIEKNYGIHPKGRLYLLYLNNHFHVVTKPTGFYNKKCWCEKCHTAFDYDKRIHHCNKKEYCQMCLERQCCFIEPLSTPIKCKICLKTCSNDTCFQNHRCDPTWACKKCEKNFKMRIIEQNLFEHMETYQTSNEEMEQQFGWDGSKNSLTGEVFSKIHKCGNSFCKDCKRFVNRAKHKCYIPPLKPQKQKLQTNGKIIYLDFETYVENNHHIPFYVYWKYSSNFKPKNQNRKLEGFFHNDGKKLDEKFYEWLFDFSLHKDFKVIAHNMGKFDIYPILQYISNHGSLVSERTIYSGTKVISLSIKQNEKSRKPFIKFIDSVNFFPSSLEKLPEMFLSKEEQIIVKKGYFPHKFSSLKNWNYNGTYPSIKDYQPNRMKKGKRKKFLEWYKSIKNTKFNFQKEMADYCKNDVIVLEKCCSRFQDLFKEITIKDGYFIDPFCFNTLASLCFATWRFLDLPPDTVANPHTSYLNHSKISIQYFDWLEHKEGISIRHALKSDGEKYCQLLLGQGQVRKVWVDGVCEENKTIYQFHGDVFHGNLRKFSENTIFYGKSVAERYDETRRKDNQLRKWCEENNYKLKIMWENDWVKLCEKNEEIQNFLKKNKRVNFRRINIRRSFFGGRVNVRKFYKKCGKSETIRYYDFTSLYPYVQKTKSFPIGHPTIIRQFEKYKGRELLDFVKSSDFFGVAYVKVLPPKKLDMPVLPTKLGEQKTDKLIFSLCFKCAKIKSSKLCECCDEDRALEGEYTSVELHKAIEKGYLILEVYEAHHFENKTNDENNYFKSYINRFLKIKTEASGFPKELLKNKQKKKMSKTGLPVEKILTQAQKERYIEEFWVREKIHLDIEKLNRGKNSGLRSLAKLMLNNLWGRLGIRDHFNGCKMFKRENRNEYFEFINQHGKSHIIADTLQINSESIEVKYKSKQFSKKACLSNVYVASFVSAYGRLQLFSAFEKIGKDLLYFDTDSVIFIDNLKNPKNIKTGLFLGDFTDELDGGMCSEYIGLMPKTYAYRYTDENNNEKVAVKMKGFCLNYENAEKISIDCLKNLMNNPNERVTFKNMKIGRNPKTKTLTHEEEVEKHFSFYYDKRIKRGNNTLPYGFGKELEAIMTH